MRGGWSAAGVCAGGSDDGVVNTFNGIPGPPPFRQGSINGLAVDSEDGIACTTTEVDFRVEFYDLAKETGFAVVLPGRPGRLRAIGRGIRSGPQTILCCAIGL